MAFCESQIRRVRSGRVAIFSFCSLPTIAPPVLLPRRGVNEQTVVRTIGSLLPRITTNNAIYHALVLLILDTRYPFYAATGANFMASIEPRIFLSLQHPLHSCIACRLCTCTWAIFCSKNKNSDELMSFELIQRNTAAVAHGHTYVPTWSRYRTSWFPNRTSNLEFFCLLS